MGFGFGVQGQQGAGFRGLKFRVLSVWDRFGSRESGGFGQGDRIQERSNYTGSLCLLYEFQQPSYSRM